jgi:hypothetical protein
LTGAIGSAFPAGAITVTSGPYAWDVNTFVGTFDSLQSTLTAASNDVWGESRTATALAGWVGPLLGSPNTRTNGSPAGPLFAFSVIGPQVYGSWTYNCNGFLCEEQVPRDTNETLTFATATPIAVPWDISGSATIFGSITGIGLGVGLRRLKSKISKNNNIKE